MLRLHSREELRFVALGAINTLFGFSVFACLLHLLRPWLGYLGVLFLTYVVAVSEAFAVQRRWVFHHNSGWFPAYLRFWLVYSVALAVNLVLLALFVQVTHVPVILAQGLSLVLTTLGTFLGHRSFSFR